MRPRRPRLEPLEDRTLLDADLGLVKRQFAPLLDALQDRLTTRVLPARLPVVETQLQNHEAGRLFTANDNYFPGNARKSQAPILSLQGHVGYALTERSWLAFNATWFKGGETRIDHVVSPDEQRNLRLGATLSIPAGASNSVKIVYNTGATTRRGTDFDTLSLQWQRVWR